MKRTTIAGLLMTPLLAVLAGCQPDTPAKHAEPSPAVAAAPVASQVPAAEPMLTPDVAQSASPAKAAKVAPSAPASAPAVAAPVPAAAQPVVAKPVVKTDAVLSDAEGRKLAQRSGCFACHTIEKKLVGPSWNEVAAKYRGQKDAEAKLINKVAKGGSGAWGATPMPPNAPRVSENDVKALVRFILSLK